MKNREYSPGELNHLVAPTVTDLLRDPNLPEAHKEDVIRANMWLSEILEELAGMTNENWKMTIVEVTGDDGARTLTAHIETPGYTPSSQTHFLFVETPTRNFTLKD